MSKILYNQTASPITINDVGYVILPAAPGSYTIPPMDYLLWAQSGNIVTEVGSGDVVVNDGSVDLNISDGIDLIKGLYPRQAFLITPKVINEPLALANTEYLVSLPIGTRKFTMHLRGDAIMKVADTAGDIAASLYFTVFPGMSYNAEKISSSATIDLYVEVSKPSQTLEIWYWL